MVPSPLTTSTAPLTTTRRTSTPRRPELLLSDTNARLAAARRLTGRRGRREAGLFLAEGAQAVREALARPATVVEVFATAGALRRDEELLTDVEVDVISDKAAAALSETVTPQGLVAVCRLPPVTLADVLAARPRLIAVLVEPNEPGNLGAIVRSADAAGADAVVVAGGADAFGGKAVRASAGSVFHLPIVAAPIEGLVDQLDAITAAGLRTLATSGHAAADLDDLAVAGTLQLPTAWLFGSEAHGLPDAIIGAAQSVVRIPLYGRAESLNLAAAAAVCLYASARAQHGRGEALSSGGTLAR